MKVAPPRKRRRVRHDQTWRARAGQAAGTIRPDVNPLDVMIASARLAQRIPNLPDERETDRRQAAIFVDGLRASAAVHPVMPSSPAPSGAGRSSVRAVSPS